MLHEPLDEVEPSEDAGDGGEEQLLTPDRHALVFPLHLSHDFLQLNVNTTLNRENNFFQTFFTSFSLHHSSNIPINATKIVIDTSKKSFWVVLEYL